MAEIMVPALGFGARAPPGRDLDDGLCDGPRARDSLRDKFKREFKDTEKNGHEKYLGTFIARTVQKIQSLIWLAVLVVSRLFQKILLGKF